MENRKKAGITGVSDVISFDLKQVILETEDGMMTIKGDDLHVNRLTVEKGEIDISGRIDSITYSEITNFAKKSESFLSRMFK